MTPAQRAARRLLDMNIPETFAEAQGWTLPRPGATYGELLAAVIQEKGGAKCDYSPTC